MRLVFVSVIFFLLNAYLAHASALRGAAVLALRPRWVFAFFALFYLIQLLAPVFDWALAGLNNGMGAGEPAFVVRLSYLAIGVMSCWFLYQVVADVIWIIIRLAGGSGRVWFYLWPVVLLATGVSVGWGVWQTRGFQVVKTDIVMPGLPDALDGYKIVQISDLHVGPSLDRRFVQDVVAAANDLSPDMVALTGDMVDGTVVRRAGDLAPLRDLKTKDGVFFVTGNHEYYWNAPAWSHVLESLGVTLLHNAHHLIQRGPAVLAVGGVPDLTSLRSGWGGEKTDPVKAFAGTPDGAVRMLLAHQPTTWNLDLSARADLQLSGHTHAGQYFPFSLIIRAFQPYVRGLYQDGRSYLYVSPGVGFWGPPMRSPGQGQIDCIVLKKA